MKQFVMKNKLVIKYLSIYLSTSLSMCKYVPVQTGGEELQTPFLHLALLAPTRINPAWKKIGYCIKKVALNRIKELLSAGIVLLIGGYSHIASETNIR